MNSPDKGLDPKAFLIPFLGSCPHEEMNSLERCGLIREEVLKEGGVRVEF